MKTLKKTLCLVLAVVMVVGVLVLPASAAADAATNDAYQTKYNEAIKVLDAIDVMKGDEGGFRAGDTITRAEAAAMVTRMALGAEGAAEYPTDVLNFDDVSADAWYASYVAYCYANEIAVGDERGFAPEDPITGYELAKMVLVVLGFDPAFNGFTSEYFSINVYNTLKKYELTEGLSGIKWGDPIKRGEVAQLVLNAITGIGDDAVVYSVADETGKILYQGPSWNDALFVAQSNGVQARLQELNNLAKDVFANLTEVETEEGEEAPTDPFGRPATEWVNGDGVDVIIPKTATQKYESGTYTEKNAEKHGVDSSWTIYYNGDPNTEVTGYAAETEGEAMDAVNGGAVPGYEVEVYENEKVVVVREAYLAVIEADDDGVLTVTGYVVTSSANNATVSVEVTDEADIYGELTEGYAAIYFKSGPEDATDPDEVILEVAALEGPTEMAIKLVEEGGYPENSYVFDNADAKNGVGLNYMFMVRNRTTGEFSQTWPALDKDTKSALYLYKGNILLIDQYAEPDEDDPTPPTTGYAYLYDSKQAPANSGTTNSDYDWESKGGESSTTTGASNAVYYAKLLLMDNTTAGGDAGVVVTKVNGSAISDYDTELAGNLGSLVYYVVTDKGYELTILTGYEAGEDNELVITKGKSEGKVPGESEATSIGSDSATIFLTVTTSTAKVGEETVTIWLTDDHAFNTIYDIESIKVDTDSEDATVTVTAVTAIAANGDCGEYVADVDDPKVPAVVLIVITGEVEDNGGDEDEIFFIVGNDNAPYYKMFDEKGNEVTVKGLKAVNKDGEIVTVFVTDDITLGEDSTKFALNPTFTNGYISAAEEDYDGAITVDAVGACVNNRIDITSDDDLTNYLISSVGKVFLYDSSKGTIVEITDPSTIKGTEKYEGYAVVDGDNAITFLFLTVGEAE